MHSSVSFALAAATVAVLRVTATPYPLNVARNEFSSLAIRSDDFIRQLGPQLSANATILTQDDHRFINATTRWSAYRQPQISVVVDLGTEADVATTVKYANAHSLPFLVVNGGHGSTKTLGQLKRGIEIRVRTLNKIRINAEGTSAFMQGGVYTGQVIASLWDAGYVTTTGSCDCVGLMGPGLGGGYGRYMGFYGLVTDNLLSMNVVLANGSAITVSERSTPDLWWGMRGAGHNFGIVTSFNTKIYKRIVDEWFYITYIFRQDKLEPLFEAVNNMMKNGTQPKELMNNALYAWVPSISTTEPVIVINIYYVGTAEQAAQYLGPYDAIGPVSSVNDSIPYPKIADATGSGYSSAVCQSGLSRVGSPVGLLTYNITTNRQVYDLFTRTTSETPALNGSILLFEGYSLGGMKTVDPDSTAFPHRSDNIIVALETSYAPDSSLDATAISWVKKTTQLFHDGDEPGRHLTTYVNYAFGDEPAEQIYGYERWRLQRLRALKRKYDPHNRFGYYNAITS